MKPKKKRSQFNSEYTKFLESGKWKQMRRDVLERDGGKCVACRSGKNLQVHHAVYRGGIGNERIDDLITLCSTCHGRIHQKTSKASNKTRSLSSAVKIYTTEEINQYMQVNQKGSTKK